MGNKIEKDNNPDVIIMDAFKLKNFFNKYYDTSEKKELLKYIPIACNYNYYADTKVAQPRFFTGTPFRECSYPLSFHLEMIFCYDCEIKISKEYHQKLIDFSANNKTNETILQEYYENKSVSIN